MLEAMAEAVEKAAVVLVCLTQKYKESPNCRTGLYTFRPISDHRSVRIWNCHKVGEHVLTYIVKYRKGGIS